MYMPVWKYDKTNFCLYIYGDTNQTAPLGAEAVKAATSVIAFSCVYTMMWMSRASHIRSYVCQHISIRVSTHAWTSFDTCIYGDASQIGRRNCEGRYKRDRFEPLI